MEIIVSVLSGEKRSQLPEGPTKDGGRSSLSGADWENQNGQIVFGVFGISSGLVGCRKMNLSFRQKMSWALYWQDWEVSFVWKHLKREKHHKINDFQKDL